MNKLIQFKNSLIHGFKRSITSAYFFFTDSDKRNEYIKAMKSNRVIFVLPIMVIYDEMLLKFLTESGRTHLFYPIIFGLALGLFLDFIIMFIKKYRYLTTLVLGLITSIIFIVECLVKKTFQVYMTFSNLLGEAGNVVGNYSSDLINSITGGLLVIVLFLLPILLLIIFKKKLAVTSKNGNKAGLLISAVLIFMVAHLCAGIFSGSAYKGDFEFDSGVEQFGLVTSIRAALMPEEEQIDIAKKDDKKKEKKEEDNKPVTYNKMDIDDKLKGNSDKEIQNISDYVLSQDPSKQNKYTGLFKGKNIIQICAEAFSDAVIDKELTPTLYRLSHNGFYFSNYYQPTWGGSTSSGEYSMLTGLVPTKGTQSMYKVKKNNLYFTIGNQLQRLNYYSGCYHNGSYTYYHRNETHQNLGYDYFLGTGNGIEDICGGYAKDEKMISKTLDTYIKYQPFNIYYMSVSGHAPYNKNKDGRVKKYYDKVKARYGTEKYTRKVMNYICYQLCLEDALKTLVKKLEKAGIANDTVIALTSDHYPYGLDVSSTFGNDTNLCQNLYGYKYGKTEANKKDRNACIIWSGCLENDKKEYAKEIKDPCYSLDMLPTLSNLFGLKYDSRMLVGRDVFSDTEPLVVWINKSWKTKKGFYNAAKGKFTPSVDKSEIPKDYVKKINKKVAAKINYSKKVASKDYWGKIFGKDAKERDNKKYFNSDAYKKLKKAEEEKKKAKEAEEEKKKAKEAEEAKKKEENSEGTAE